MDLATVNQLLEQELPPGRLAHVRRVAALARSLAGRHDVDPEAAELAGLYHDRCRQFPADRLLAECRERGLAILPEDEHEPLPRLHGLLASCYLAEEVGSADPAIQAAIASHTLGRPGMTPLEQVVFAADYAEPGRAQVPGMLEVRRALDEDLLHACRLACDGTLAYLLKTEHAIHPLAVETRNWLLREERRRPPAPAGPSRKELAWKTD